MGEVEVPGTARKTVLELAAVKYQESVVTVPDVRLTDFY